MKTILAVAFLLSAFSTTGTIVKKPAVAGYFYPADPGELREQLEAFFEAVDLGENHNRIPLGLISPHAGIVYSGQTAAYGYSLLEPGMFDTVILMGTSHNFFKNNISVYNGDFFSTPLGVNEIDKEITGQILKSDQRFVFDPAMHKPEHSLEVQLPFLQYSLKNFQAVLILTSTNDYELLQKLGETLIHIKENSLKKILFVCSTDLSHYHDYETACDMDKQTIDLILKKDLDQLTTKIRDKECEMCGYHALIPFLKIMDFFGSTDSILLNYMNSGDATGNFRSEVVGYCSILFPDGRTSEKSKDGVMNNENKRYLLELARESVEFYLENHKPLKPVEPEDKILKEERAVFVTLNKGNDLRGCIGHMQARRSTYEAVAEMAVSAAFQDPRFPPLDKRELKDIEIEISILTPMKKIDDFRKIRLGIDGVWIQKGFRSGVYLPQVATETGWDLETFLSSLCAHKAGLSADAYLDPSSEIFIFQVEKFSEKDLLD